MIVSRPGRTRLVEAACADRLSTNQRPAEADGNPTCWQICVPEIDCKLWQKRLKVHGSPWHSSGNPAHISIAGTRADSDGARESAHAGADRGSRGTEGHLTLSTPQLWRREARAYPGRYK
jgi:hypothetical protein